MPIVAGLVDPHQTYSQAGGQPPSVTAVGSDGNAPSFDVASVRADHSGLGFNTQLTLTRFVMERWRVIDMIEYAYDVKDPQVIGGPKWINSETFDVDAKIQDSEAEKEHALPQEQRISLMRLRVRDLLAKRFGLKLHPSVENLPVLALVMSDKQPKFAEAKPPQNSSLDAGTPQISMNMVGNEWVLKLENASLRYLIGPLSGQPEIGGHLLVDETGLTKNYDLTLRWKMQNLAAPGSAASDSAASEDVGTSLFTALREQLGLKLESRKEPADTLVIDQIERPSGN